MPGRFFTANSSGYRYGFNGQEKSNEIEANGNSYTAEFWQYDARIVRRWNLDPKPTVGISQYSVFGGNPIWYSDMLGDSISPGRTQGVNFIIVPNKTLRNEDKSAHSWSAYAWDYRKAKKMERKSGGTLKVIEADNAQDAINQIKGSLSPEQYVQNLTIDFHRSSGPFDDPQFDDGSMQNAFTNLANGYIGKGSNVYLGMCWAGGNSDPGVAMNNLTERASNWLDGATTYGHQAAASSVSFYLNNNFSGPVWEDYGKTEGNLARRGYHTISYYDTKLKQVRSVEVKAKVYILNSGQIHMQGSINLGSLPTTTPYMGASKVTIPPPPFNLNDEEPTPPEH